MNKLVATTLESKFSVYDLRTQHPTKGFAALTEKVVWCVIRGTQNGVHRNLRHLSVSLHHSGYAVVVRNSLHS